jgi:UDP-N-acetylmuramoyl-tripeptide--D-alanyl-D-alanine ligase
MKNQASFNNHIGLPQTLLSLHAGHKAAVLELGTNHFGEIAYLAQVSRPDAVIVTCIDDVHLKYFKTRLGVLKEKTSVFDVCPGALPIVNADDPLLKAKTFGVKPFYFGRSRTNSIFFDLQGQDKESLLFSINSKYTLRLKSLGLFNVYNAMAALALSLYLGKPLGQAVERLSAFSFPKMRLEAVVAGGITFINDAYNSNPSALAKGLKALDNIQAKRKIGVLGDMLELGARSLSFHRRASGPILKAGFCRLVLVGKLMGQIGKSLIRKGFSRDKIFFAKDAAQAKDQLYSIARKGDVVFLKGSRSLGLEKIIP